MAVCKVSAVQAGEPEFGSPEPTPKTEHEHRCLGDTRTEKR